MAACHRCRDEREAQDQGPGTGQLYPQTHIPAYLTHFTGALHCSYYPHHLSYEGSETSCCNGYLMYVDQKSFFFCLKADVT